GVDDGTALRRVDRVVVVRLDVGDLLVARPVSVDHAQLVEIAACTGEEDASNVGFCRPGERRVGRQGSWQVGVWGADIPEVDVHGGYEQTKSNGSQDEDQSKR